MPSRCSWISTSVSGRGARATMRSLRRSRWAVSVRSTVGMVASREAARRGRARCGGEERARVRLIQRVRRKWCQAQAGTGRRGGDHVLECADGRDRPGATLLARWDGTPVGWARRARQAGCRLAAGHRRRQVGGQGAVRVDRRRIEVASATAFHEAAYAAGVPTPQVRRTEDGAVFAPFNGGQARLYEWVDLLPPDRLLDPARSAPSWPPSTASRLRHRPGRAGPVLPRTRRRRSLGPAGGAARRRRERRSPAGLADLRDELVALESWIEPPADAVDLSPRPVGRQRPRRPSDGGVCVLDWEESGPADPSQELGYVLFEFARSDPGRARDAHHRLPGCRGPATVSRRGHFSMLIAQLGHITELAATDWLAAQPPLSGSCRLRPRGSARSSTSRTPECCSTPSWPVSTAQVTRVC